MRSRVPHPRWSTGGLQVQMATELPRSSHSPQATRPGDVRAPDELAWPVSSLPSSHPTTPSGDSGRGGRARRFTQQEIRAQRGRNIRPR